MCEEDGMKEWKECKLGDICKSNINSYSEKDNWSFVNYLDTGNITENKISDIQFIDLSSESLPSRARRKVQLNDIIYSTVRPNQKHFGIIKNQPENFLVSTGFAVLHINKTIADPNFIFYNLIQNENTESLHAIAEQTTSAYPAIKPSDIENLSIKLPPLPTQQKIAAILSSLDDKIELNNKINTNLEQQAQALVKNWFVDKYEKEGTIGDYCSVKSGFAFKSSWWQDEGTKVIRIGDIEQGCLNLETCAHVADDKIEVAKDFIVQGGDLVIAMTGATIGKFSMIPKTQKPILVNQRVGKFFLGNNPLEKVPFIYCTLKQEEVITEFINRGQGSAQPNISTGDILSIPCWIPSKNEIDNFNRTSQPMFETIISNQEENRKLSKVRDILLPKLMSGQIDAYKIEF